MSLRSRSTFSSIASTPSGLNLWNAPDREAAIVAAIEQSGEDDSRLLSGPEDGEPIDL